MSELEEHDERRRRCPRLGHAVTFRYCRTQEGGRLCARILDCWWEVFDVRGFLQEHYPEERVEELRRRERPDKLASILEIVHRVQRTQSDDTSGETD